MSEGNQGSKVLLIGIGADGTNTKPLPPIYDNGTFEYVPIPETQTGTAEPMTYANWGFAYQDTTAATYFRRIRPNKDEEWIQGDELDNHPFHRDPNFEALTFGDKKGDNGTGRELKKLRQGDVLGFYAGLQNEGRKHRYVIGHFTVNNVIDLEHHRGERQAELLNESPNNAHSLRFQGEGESKHDDVVIIDGTDPGGLLSRALQISSYDRFGSSQYYLTDDFADEFRVRGHDHDGAEKDDKEWLGFKDPLWCDITSEKFRSKTPELR
ncbi:MULTISPECIES: hypothetical protein [Halorussus]|uniref:Nmad3 family putative nucleotide modification protein n=1 Tax=Halorussus TaxID=1070314 RepID=UPI0013B3B69D|nr:MULTISPECIES: hypothetical protein [Halorussus]NHN60061.1 hypothetical protein [Halorussus sp. JP-T4]